MTDDSETIRPATVDLAAEYEASGVGDVLRELDEALVGLAPVKQRIRETAALLLVDKARRADGAVPRDADAAHELHRQPGHRKDNRRPDDDPANVLHRLGYVRKGHLVTVTRDDLVGQYIGHTAPKTKEVLKKAMGGVLFIDEAYYLYKPDNERDYGQEAIEILLQVMENNRDDLVVIMAGYADKMDKFFSANPGFRSRIAHHIDFPDYSDEELLRIGTSMLQDQNYELDAGAKAALAEYIALRRDQPHFANARSIRNALDRARLRQANRLFSTPSGPIDAAELSTIREPDIRASRVFPAASISTVPSARRRRSDFNANCPRERAMSFDRSIKIAPSILSADFANFGAGDPRRSRIRAATGSMWT
jgi:probable Rubsico expression protein CbbX